MFEPILMTFVIVTARKRSLGQGNVFTGVCDSINRGMHGPWGLHGPGGCMVSGGGSAWSWGTWWRPP